MLEHIPKENKAFGIIVNNCQYLKDSTVWIGGPVHTNTQFVISGQKDLFPQMNEFDPGLYYSVLGRPVDESIPKSLYRSFYGFASWQSDQLKDEIENMDSWVIAKYPNDLIFPQHNPSARTELLELEKIRAQDWRKKRLELFPDRVLPEPTITFTVDANSPEPFDKGAHWKNLLKYHWENRETEAEGEEAEQLSPLASTHNAEAEEKKESEIRE
jgi:hypothetical protein